MRERSVSLGTATRTTEFEGEASSRRAAVPRRAAGGRASVRTSTRSPGEEKAGGLVVVGGRGELAFDVVDEVEQLAGFPGAVPLRERDRVEDTRLGDGGDGRVHGLLGPAEDLLRVATVTMGCAGSSMIRASALEWRRGRPARSRHFS